METGKLAREVVIWIITLIPFVYLAIVWEELPERVSIFFNLKGEAEGWGSINFLIDLIFFTTVVLNLVLLVLPKIDPKQKLQLMGSKYHQLRFILIAFMAAIAIYLIYGATSEETLKPNFLYLLLGAFFALLGNYFQAVKHNYFIGIRTPWTQESETMWRKTHWLAGRLWIAGGITIILLSFLSDSAVQQVHFTTTVGIPALVPIAYS